MEATRSLVSNEALEISPAHVQLTRQLAATKLLELLEKIVAQLEVFGISVRPSSRASLIKLETLPLEKVELITKGFELQESWLLPVLNQKEIVENFEQEMLKRALDHYGLEADSDFLKTIEPDHMVELYGPDMTQIYRSFNFYRISGYSLLDLSVFEWWVLWERPSHVMEEMTRVAQAVYNDFVPVRKYELSRHLVREIYDSGNTAPFLPRTILADMKYAGSLRLKDGDGSVSGAIATSVGQIVSTGDAALSVDFI
jgi:hypothetical protein